MLVDTHFHLPHEKYEKSSTQIIFDANEAGVKKLIAVGTSLKDDSSTLEVIADFENVFAVAGVYPHEDQEKSADEIYGGLLDLYQKNRRKIVGIGECGFDLAFGANGLSQNRPVEDQREIFKMQVGFAIQHELPIVLHNRNGNEQVMEVLSHFPKKSLKGVCHSFAQNWSYAKKMLDLNFHISFSGLITFKNCSPEVLEVVKKVPADKYLVETDAPYLSPHPLRGKINYPENVRITAQKVSEIRGVPLAQVERETFENSCRLFGICRP